MSSKSKRRLGYWLVLCALLSTWAFLSFKEPSDSLDQQTFTQMLRSDLISKATITYRSGSPLQLIEGTYYRTDQNGQRLVVAGKPVQVAFRALVDLPDDIKKQILDKHFILRQEDASLQTAVYILTAVVLVAALIFYFFLRQSREAKKRVFDFGESKARLRTGLGQRVTFKDVAGVEEAKAEVTEIVEFLRDPKRFQTLGGRIPKGVLLVGLPGTGKTLLARAIAGEADVPFFSISGSDFVEMFVGVGASRVRDMFARANKSAPCLIFIDEIDAMGRHRRSGTGSGQDEHEQTLNALLVEMDGFGTQDGVIIIAATNRLDVLDPALLRPGRFDRKVVVHPPDTKGRLKIINLYTKKIRVDDKVDFQALAKSTTGFTGADLEAMFNEAALIAARIGRKGIQMEDFEVARNKVLHGVGHRINLEKPEDKWRIALHEIAHLSTSFSFSSIQPINYISLHMPFKPEWFVVSDGLNVDSFQAIVGVEAAEGTLSVLLAGRAAEMFFLGDTSSLSASDTAIATALAYQMLTRWGMNEAVGLTNNTLTKGSANESAGAYNYLIGTSKIIDREMKKVLALAYQRSFDHVKANCQQIADWAARLYESESLGAVWIETAEASVRFKATMKGKLSEQSIETGGDHENLSNSLGVSGVRKESSILREASSIDAKLSILRRTRDVLDLQATTLGLNTPPHIITQLQDVKAEIVKLEVC
jgi:cell division protease FtsH